MIINYSIFNSNRKEPSLNFKYLNLNFNHLYQLNLLNTLIKIYLYQNNRITISPLLKERIIIIEGKYIALPFIVNNK